MPERDRAVRLLCIISNDFGELSSALYFLKGEPVNATLALPPRLYSLHAWHLSVPTLLYQTASELAAHIRLERPDIVMLYSGYLFGINQLFDVAALKNLVAEARDAGCRLVTTDPFLGIMSDLDPSTFNFGAQKNSWLADHFAQVNDVLNSTTHLYPARIPGSAGRRAESFFNPTILSTPAEIHAMRPSRDTEAKQRWLFVLSGEDYGLQISLFGREQFHQLLAERVLETSQAGRRAVVVAPEGCVDSLRWLVAAGRDVALIPFCDQSSFQAMSLSAEYAFYWNIFSHSVFERAINGLPVFFFDTGHLARAIPRLHTAGVETYYFGEPPAICSSSHELIPDTLAELARQQKESFTGPIAEFHKLPGVNDVITRLLAEPC